MSPHRSGRRTAILAWPAGRISAASARPARYAPSAPDAKTSRSITISRWEPQLSAARTRQTDPAWQADYRATRPKVERKIAHLMRRRHGGRRARMRGQLRVAADFNLLAAAVNLARLAALRLAYTPHHGWTRTAP